MIECSTAWWGVILTAKDEDARKVLQELVQLLPEEAQKSYESGKIEVTDTEEELRIVINR
jgi:hypothetical protein